MTEQEIEFAKHDRFLKTNKKWQFFEWERPKGICYDCHRPYGSFVDLVVSDSIWEQINPTYVKGAGLLCPNCIGDRLRTIKLIPVDCTIQG